MKRVSWDERRDLAIPGDKEATIKFCADHFVLLCKNAISDHGFFAVALSGGSTPKALFELLSSRAYKHLIDWSKVFLFWSDERAVSPDDPDSNYHMAMEAGLKNLQIPPSHIHRMEAEKDIEKNAERYQQIIYKVLGARGFDLMMLGMGDDGHTASLFPGTDALHIHGRLVAPNFVKSKNTWRMTLTFECINASSHIAIYVLGDSKKEMLSKVLSAKDPKTFPICEVGTKDHKALLIADSAAAQLLI